MGRSNGNIHKKPKRATKSHNEQQKAFACFGVWDRIDSISKTRKSNEEQQKATKDKWKHATKPKTSNKKQQRTFFIPIFIHSYQFWTYGRWLISRAMKIQKEQRRAMKSNEKQQKATKSNKLQQRTLELKNQNGQEKTKTSNERHKKSKWKPGLSSNQIIWLQTEWNRTWYSSQELHSQESGTKFEKSLPFTNWLSVSLLHHFVWKLQTIKDIFLSFLFITE